MTFSRSTAFCWFACLSLVCIAWSGRSDAQQDAAAKPAPAAVTSPLPGSTKPTFDVFDFQIEGNTTLEQQVIERAVYSFLGERKTIDDVEAARANLEKVYRDKGYGTVSVLIPEQRVAQGTVTLRVQEGRVERLQVLHASYYSQGRIMEVVESLAAGKVPYFPKVQEELAQVNTSADRKVTPLLRPGKSPGTTDVDLEVVDALPLHGSVTLDDYYSPLTTALRLTGAIEYDNLFQRDQKLSLLYQTSPEDSSQVKLWSVAYTIPIADQFIAFSFVRSDSATVAGIGGLNLFGRGRIIGLHDVIPFTTSPGQPGLSFSHVLNIGVDYKDFDQNVTLGSNAGQGFSTPIRYVPFSIAYQGTSIRDGGQSAWGASLEFALRDLGNTASEFDAKRFKALSNFAILKLSVDRTQPLGAGMSLYGRLETQISDQPLVSNEQFVIGGNESVRGYLSASAAGDSGARASIELRSPNLVSQPLYSITQFQAHAFIDGASVRIISPLPGQASAFDIVGTGIGFRAKSGTLVDFSLDLAWPMRSILYTKAWSPRLQGAASLAF